MYYSYLYLCVVSLLRETTVRCGIQLDAVYMLDDEKYGYFLMKYQSLFKPFFNSHRLIAIKEQF